MSIRTKFYLFYLSGITLALSVCLYGVLTYKSITQESDILSQRYSNQLVMALQVQVHFKQQVQAWQSSLLHRDDKDVLAHYTDSYYQHADSVGRLTGMLVGQMSADSVVQEPIQEFIGHYEEVTGAHRNALNILMRSSNEPSIPMDSQLFGMEQRPGDLISDIVSALIEERDRVFAMNEEERSRWEFKISLIAILTLVVISIAFSFFLSRTILDPLFQLKRGAKRLSEGYYDTQLVIQNNQEISAIATVLNRLSNSLNEYTCYMEDSLKQLTRLATELADSKEVVAQKEARLKAIVDNMADGVITLRDDRCIEMFNPAASKIFGYSEEETLGQCFDILFENGETVTLFPCDEVSIVQEVRGIRRDGRTFLMDCVISEFSIDGLSHYVLSMRDVTLRKLTEQKLVQLANYDSLTHLPNRNMLQSRLKNALELSSYKNTLLAVLYINIDNFKRINDTFGYVVGDNLLKQFATRLKTYCSISDLVARLGGDEFALILDHVGDVNAPSKAAELILNAMLKPFNLSGHEIYVNCCIGIALFPNDASDAEDLIRQSNIAVHHAKSIGDGQSRYYSKDMDVCALEKLQLEGRVRRAVAKDEFIFYYQPQVDIITGKVIGVEALLRWDDPKTGLIPPNEFMPLLEESGLITQMGEFLLTLACQQGRKWHNAEHQALIVSVNLSARQFEDPNLLAMIKRVIEQTNFNPQRLELEITESAIMADAEKSERILKALSAMGITVAIDDFGTGYSSLSYLRSFSVQTLKIDRSFVKEIDVSQDDKAISQSIINMAHNLRMNVVAEGVETERQSQILKSLGCRVVQGFYYSKPLSANAMTDFLRKNHQQTNTYYPLTSNDELVL